MQRTSDQCCVSGVAAADEDYLWSSLTGPTDPRDKSPWGLGTLSTPGVSHRGVWWSAVGCGNLLPPTGQLCLPLALALVLWLGRGPLSI